MSLIETERLILRPLDISDASQEYVDWLNDPDVNQYLETRHSVQTLESCIDFIKSCNNDPTTYLFGIFLKESNKHIGNVKIGAINTIYKRGQLSLFIGDKECWGKGYSRELVKSITNYAFEHLGLSRMEAGCYEDNIGSLKVFLKSGYNVEGFFRDHVIHDDKYQGCFWLGALKDEFL
ncbi:MULTISPECIES: GNAT family N-acetyltransferase [unclassified Psychrobacter]|uniref:GNAT family N-acetyltransferase n=1 Tax=unclassified Psychrobacter TaxID=196806 RepID=UPI0004722C0B|nr:MULTISPECIES: GNAT family protein [unclassified Psychrobacter]